MQFYFLENTEINLVCSLLGFFIYANIYTLQNNLAAFHNHINILLFYEMFIINVIDDIFYNCLSEVHYFVIKYLGITQFQVKRLQVKNRHEYQNTCLTYYLNLVVNSI